jgi:sulfate permease, SulP family
VVAGVSVALVLIPQSLAYAQLAGMPPYRGLYAAAIPPLVAAPLASSPYLQPGPTAVTSLLTLGALTPLAPIGSDRYVTYGLMLALLVGLVRLAVGLLRAGVLAYLLAQPVLLGFVPAAAILIIASQLPSALGAPTSGSHVLVRAASALEHPERWAPSTLVVTAGATALLLAGRRLGPRFPAVLVAVGLALGYAAFTGYAGARVGPLGAGLPPLTTSLPISIVPSLLLPAVVIALIGFAEASSIAQTYAVLDRKRWDPDREFVSQGAANIAAGLTGGFPVGASFSRSALNRLAGARTSASGFVTGVAVLALLPLSFVLEPLPTAVLAVTVIVAVVPLIRLAPLVQMARYSRIQLTIVLTALVLTLVLSPHLEWALLAAVGLSIAIHLWRELRLELDSTFDGESVELRPQGVLWFGTARRLEDEFVNALAAHPGATELVLRLDALGRIDVSGALALERLLEDARRAGLRVTTVAVPGHAQALLGRVLGDRFAETDI